MSCQSLVVTDKIYSNLVFIRHEMKFIGPTSYFHFEFSSVDTLVWYFMFLWMFQLRALAPDLKHAPVTNAV